MSVTATEKELWKKDRLKISNNGHYLLHRNGTPFFWLADTWWSLFSRTTREEAEEYLEERHRRGFNVIVTAVANQGGMKNRYGKYPFLRSDPARPAESEGDDYGYWEHVDYIISRALEMGIYIGMVPLKGLGIKRRLLTCEQTVCYANWLGNKFRTRSNIIWINGSETSGEGESDIERSLGQTIRKAAPHHLITCHPGRTGSSSEGFHEDLWLDFNMIQSESSLSENTADHDIESIYNTWVKQDNWRGVMEDFHRTPARPVVAGEPYPAVSRESTAEYLKEESDKKRWESFRRAAYWSLFAGACGFTLEREGDELSLFPEHTDSVEDQLNHLKTLMLSVPYFDRVPDYGCIYGEEGVHLERILATRGKDYLFIYNFSGRSFQIQMGRIEGNTLNAWWFCPRKGTLHSIGSYPNRGIVSFHPPGGRKEGNDWVLILEDAAAEYFPG